MGIAFHLFELDKDQRIQSSVGPSFVGSKRKGSPQPDVASTRRRAMIEMLEPA